MVKAMKQRMSQAVGHRLLMTELNVVAALLDQSQCNMLSLQEFILAQKTTDVELISAALDKYVGSDVQLGSAEATGGPRDTLTRSALLHGKWQNRIFR